MKTNLCKRLLSLMLAVLTVFGLFSLPASAASTLEEAMKEVNVYAKKADLNWLTMNGSIQTQHYTYYNYTSVQTGETTQIPAYCVDPRLRGVPVLVPEGTAMKYSAKSTVSDPKVCGILGNGYPHEPLTTLKVNTVEEAYYATKTALWTYLLGNWSINKLGINPNLTGEDKAAAQRVLAAAKWIYNRGMGWTKLVSPKLTATPDSQTAYAATVNGEKCFQQVFTITSGTWSLDPVRVTLAGGAPEGARILDMDDKEVSSVRLTTTTPYQGKFKVVYPADSIEGQSGTAQVNLTTNVVQYAIYYATCLETDKYGNVQDYMLDTDPHLPMAVSVPSRYSSDSPGVPTPETPEEPEKGSLRVHKLSDTGENLEGVTVQIKHITSGRTLSAQTGPGGVAEFDELEPGAYEVRETAGIEGWIAETDTIQTVAVVAGDASEVSIINREAPGLRLIKYDRSSLQLLGGVTFRIWRDGEFLGDYTTDELGEILLLNAKPGTYRMEEVQSDDDHITAAVSQEVELKAGDGIRQVVFYNDRKPGIKLLKVDSSDLSKTISDAVFEIKAVDGSYGPKEFTTDANGEIDLSGLSEGAYTVTEKSCPGYVIDEAQRTIQLKANETAEFIFTNSEKPKLYLKKLSSDRTALPGVTFRLARVEDGTHYMDKTTDANGEILWEGLEPGVYSLVETATDEHHILDPREHHIELFPGRTSTIVLNNDRKPELTVRKTCSITGDPIKGAKFQVWYASNHTDTGELNDLGFYYSNENGEFTLEAAQAGWYKVTEVEPAKGYAIKNPATQEFYLRANEEKTVTFENTPLSALIVYKYDSVTKAAIEGCEFELRYLGGDVSGTGGTAIGRYRTSPNGSFTVTGLKQGYYIVEEVESDTNHVIDAAPQSFYISGKEQDVIRLYFSNSPKGSLLVKKIDSVTHEPLSDVEFLVTKSDGTLVGNANGKFVTDSSGSFLVEGIEPGTTLVVKETRTRKGYILDDAPQTVQLKAGATVVLEFRNQPKGRLVIQKLDSVTKEPLEGVQFKITYAAGCYVDAEEGKLSSNGLYWTDKNGQIVLDGITGTLVVTEEKTIPGYTIHEETRSQTVVINPDDTQTLRFYNDPLGGLLVHKVDSTTKKGISGVTFLVYDATHKPIDQITTDQSGYAYLEDLNYSGRLYLRELENPGYLVDSELKTVYIKPGETTEVEWENTPITGQIQIVKTSADYNSTNGWAAGTPLPDVEFEIYDYRTNNLVDTVRTDKNGIAKSRPLPLGRYKVVESKAASFYERNATPMEAELEFSGQIVKLAMTNKSVNVNVSIKKTGYAEVMPGQSIRYDFSGIGNNSNVSLSSFYWRDTLPVDAVRLDKIVTGTYNAPGNYKVVYQTNLSGGAWRTLADNLSTGKNHVLDASPAALRLASNEYVTQFMFSFGVVPANFRQVEAPQVYCTVLSSVKGGAQFVNQADVGGIYQGQWYMATTRWVTKVYRPAAPAAPATPLPRTGY